MEETKYLIRRSAEHYETVDIEDNFSDSTRVSSFVDEKVFEIDNRGSTRQKLDSILTWGRWFSVITMQFMLIMLLLLLFNQPAPGSSYEIEPELEGKVLDTGDDASGLYMTMPHDYTYLRLAPHKYFPNASSNSNREEVRRNWDMLMPKGSGRVAIPDYKDYELLGAPITDDPLSTEPLYETSWTHAIHCLYYTVDAYHQLLVNGPSKEDNSERAAHCFEYLRTSIMCNLDMTLEGRLESTAEKSRGHAHVCKNKESVMNWIEERRVDDVQSVQGPKAAPKEAVEQR